MTVKSMTGFGRGEAEDNGTIYSVEIRCVNNRYLDLKIKLPKNYSAVEDSIRKKVTSSLLRGRVDVLVTIDGKTSNLKKVHLNEDLAIQYAAAIRSLQQSTTPDNNELSAYQLAAFPDVLSLEKTTEDMKAVWDTLGKAVDEALINCTLMRTQEGEQLAVDLLQRLDSFAATIETVSGHMPELINQRQKALQERLEKLLDAVSTTTVLDPNRLAQEIAILADKSDVTEEIVRLRSHIEQFKKFMQENGVIGRKLDFLIQEFLREVNTIASKINDASIAHHSVELKSELEKMREQIQNIE